MEKQERAFTVWANSVLQPDEAHANGGLDLASQQLRARSRALLWSLYSQDEDMITVMIHIEQRVNEGLLCTKNEVGLHVGSV